MRRLHTLRILHVRQPVFTLGLLVLVRFTETGRPSLEEDVSSDVAGDFDGTAARRGGNIWTFAGPMQRGIGSGRESGWEVGTIISLHPKW
jgi:hypothetical protein